MASLNRIVLLDTWGDEMFSGSSVLSDRVTHTARAPEGRSDPPPPTVRVWEEEDEEPIPETLRSSVFVRVHEPAPPSIDVEIEDVDEDDRAA